MKRSTHLRSICAVMLLMLLGKLLSLLANQAYLSYFGADNEQLNIFSWVLQIPNYLFQSFGAALSSVVIPLYAAMIANSRREDADRFGSNILCVSALFTLLLICLGMALSGALPRLTDFSDHAYAAMTLRLMLPVMLLYALTNIYQGILQSLGNHLAPALTNLPSGIVILLYLAFFADRFGVTGLLVAVVIGLFLQFAILPVPAHRSGFRFRPVLDLRDPTLRTAGGMMLPVILGAGAYQLNMFWNSTLMTAVAPDRVSLFQFVQTLILTAVMTLSLAVTSVKYPALSAHAAKSDMMSFRSELSGTLGGMIFLLTPVTVGLICLGHPLLELISLHGKIRPEDIRTEYFFLLCYCPCIIFLGIKEIADRALYALHETKTSGHTGVVILVVNAALGYFLSTATPLGPYGIPLAYSAAILLGTALLLHRLRRKILFFPTDLKATAGKSILCSAIMGICVTALHRAFSGFFLPVLAGILIYFTAAYLLKTSPIFDFFRRNQP